MFPSSIIKDRFSASTAKSFVLTQLCQPRIKVPRFSVFFVHIVSGCVCCLCALVCLCVRDFVWERERKKQRARAKGSIVYVNYIWILYISQFYPQHVEPCAAPPRRALLSRAAEIFNGRSVRRTIARRHKRLLLRNFYLLQVGEGVQLEGCLCSYFWCW